MLGFGARTLVHSVWYDAGWNQIQLPNVLDLILSALERNRVSYVVIGGFARVVHGSAETTRGLDIVPSLREENLRRLGRVLDDLDARGPDRRPVDAASLASSDPIEAPAPPVALHPCLPAG